jgi:hypothetical protein
MLQGHILYEARQRLALAELADQRFALSERRTRKRNGIVPSKFADC